MGKDDGTFDWKFTKKSEKQFAKLDHANQKRILAWLNKNITGSTNPRALGESLEGEFKDYWKFKIGGFRIIADIVDNEFVVIIVKTGKRGQVYRVKR